MMTATAWKYVYDAPRQTLVLTLCLSRDIHCLRIEMIFGFDWGDDDLAIYEIGTEIFERK
jgi:hypothetical protein